MSNASMFNIVYTIASLYTVYTLYIFMKVFFERKKVKNKIIIVTFMLYFLGNNMAYFLIGIPLVQLGVNMILILLLTFNFEASMQKHVISVIYICILMMLVETLVGGMLSGIGSAVFEILEVYQDISGIIAIRILTLMMVLLLKNYKSVKKDIIIPMSQWIAVIVIPMGTLYIMLIILQGNYQKHHIVLSILTIFAINIIVFHIYNVIVKAFEAKVEELLVRQQNSMYNKELELMKSSMRIMQSVNHDVKNHLSVISAFLSNGNNEKAEAYLKSIERAYQVIGEHSKSGNIVIDSILNFKIERAVKYNITTKLTTKIPEEMQFSQFDMTIILSNLIDNAIEGCLKSKEEREMEIILIYRNGMLQIKITNNYDGEVKLHKGKIVTRNKDKKNHGIGLRNTGNAIEKYNGVWNIKCDKKQFCVEIMLYVEENYVKKNSE